ncbi:MAG: amidohydrolase [Vicinamibacterales bacterium]
MRTCARLSTVLAAIGLLAVTFAAGCSEPVEPASLVLRNGRISTVDAAKPEVQALAVRGDTIVAVGTDDEIAPYVGEATEVIDLAGRRAIPGFIEAHAHFTGIGQSKLVLNLMKVKSWGEIVAMVADAAAKAQPGEWIVGRGWHQEKWDKVPEPNVEGFPFHDELSKVSPNNPVLLTHASGHATFANKKAMEIAGVDRRTPNPPGGEILKDAKGNPIGVFRETASGLLRRSRDGEMGKRTPEQVEADARREIELAAEECLKNGITSVHDAGVSFVTVDRYRRMADEGKLGVRLYVMINERNERIAQNAAKYKLVDANGKHVTVRAIKRLADGALGPRGAWLLEPYEDAPQVTGLNTYPMDQLAETAKLAIENGWQLAVHAIGDRANRETIDVYEAAMKAHPNQTDVRWRIEHAQHISAADIQRFGRLGIIASMQGIHATSDGPYVLARLGAARAEEGAYVWQKLMKSGALICNGTDAPVEEVSTIPNFHALVTRKMANGQAFYPEQRMSREEALRAYTLNGAFAAFQEASRGSLAVGKLADIAVLSTDIMTVPEDEILSAQIAYTIVGGKVLYKGATGNTN